MPSTVWYRGQAIPRMDGESVLDALIRSGADVSFSCKKGSCQVCMLRASQGQPSPESQAGLRDSLRERNHFLPCQLRTAGDLWVERPQAEDLGVPVMVAAKDRLAPDVVRLRLDAGPNFRWLPGQFVNLRRQDGLVRSYSLASSPERDYFLDLHIRRYADGQMSRWLCDEVEVGAELEVQGPHGRCHYRAQEPSRSLLLIGGGTGLGPLVGIVREALAQGHRGEIFLYHGARQRAGLYLDDELADLAAQHANLHYCGCVSDEDDPGHPRGLVPDIALPRHPGLSGFRVFLAGSPEMVHATRFRVVQQGAARAFIHADPFETQHPHMPDDAATVAAIAPEPELWTALRHGDGLTEILSDFYNRVFADPRLFPFFHNVTKQRVIEKQYEFLHQLFTGNDIYFGLRPFNAHHWMVISDELFDYREELMEDCMRRYGLAEPLIWRWNAIHERFRRDIVKASPRGIVEQGVERYLERFETMLLTVGSLCDGCGQVIAEGTTIRYHVRTGQIYCPACQAAPPSGAH